jgi:hypothetical protein
MNTQYVESLIVEVDVRYKPLLKASELLLLLLVMMINPTRNTTELMEMERMIVSSGEVGRAALPYIHEVR